MCKFPYLCREENKKQFMADDKIPGIYIEEIPHLPPSIISVETAIPSFVTKYKYFLSARRKKFALAFLKQGQILGKKIAALIIVADQQK